jgi:hypothetical protein
MVSSSSSFIDQTSRDQTIEFPQELKPVEEIESFLNQKIASQFMHP